MSWRILMLAIPGIQRFRPPQVFSTAACLWLLLSSPGAQASNLSTVSGRFIERLSPAFVGTIHLEIFTVEENGSLRAEAQVIGLGVADKDLLPPGRPRWSTDSVSWYLHTNVPAWLEAPFAEALAAYTSFSLYGPSLLLETERLELGFDPMDGINMLFVDEAEEFIDEFIGAGTLATVVNFNTNEGELVGSEMVLAKGAAEWLEDPLRQGLLFAEELFAHEVGHTMGLPHSCGDASTPECVQGTIEDDATLRASLHLDSRGNGLMQWDLLAMEELYGAQGSCVADETTLCLPGESLDDPRFAVSVDVDTDIGPGFEGPGKAVPLDSVGIGRGGLFWFFSRPNPEVLIKILNACSAYGRWWVFLSAGTTVHFTTTIVDTETNEVVWTFENPDGQSAEPVTDTQGFACE